MEKEKKKKKRINPKAIDDVCMRGAARYVQHVIASRHFHLSSLFVLNIMQVTFSRLMVKCGDVCDAHPYLSIPSLRLMARQFPSPHAITIINLFFF
jgi:hypothetical protein